MDYITNTTIPVYDLDHIYIVDTNDDNAERRMLLEAMVNQVTIASDGTVSFLFKLAGETGATDITASDVYYDMEAYRATGKKTEAIYSTVSNLLNLLGISPDYYETFKATPNSSQLLLPKGYIINDMLMVEELSFPASWEFTRSITSSLGESGNHIVEVSGWSHNAKFHGKEVFATREDALKDHKIKLLRLNGVEENV